MTVSWLSGRRKLRSQRSQNSQVLFSIYCFITLKSKNWRLRLIVTYCRPNNCPRSWMWRCCLIRRSRSMKWASVPRTLSVSTRKQLSLSDRWSILKRRLLLLTRFRVAVEIPIQWTFWALSSKKSFNRLTLDSMLLSIMFRNMETAWKECNKLLLFFKTVSTRLKRQLSSHNRMA